MKKTAKIVSVLIIGFTVAMILMGTAIYFGYSNAYRLGVAQYTVKLLGISIYELTQVESEYTGTAIGTHMGLICSICMAASFAVYVTIQKISMCRKMSAKIDR